VTDVTGQTPGIKWTNDLVLQQRKLGGILTELSVENGLVNWAIVGIGINCCQKESDFPEEIRNIAISLGLDASLRPQLTAALIRRMYTLRQELFQPDAIMHRFRTRCITIGQEISILRGDQVLHGVAVGVESDGALTVRLSGGDLTSIASGEVSIRGMYGYV
jgi:BirA family biotin operon repressor/biotin-[acetyl-CoA-carboxylase] ligase